MHYLSPKMVCETKIVAEDHESISGTKKETLIVSSSQMWPPLVGSPASSPASLDAPGDERGKEGVWIREFHPSEQEVVRRIFYEGIMERIPNTAFRGLKDQPLTQLLYGTMAGLDSGPLPPPSLRVSKGGLAGIHLYHHDWLKTPDLTGACAKLPRGQAGWKSCCLRIACL